LGKEKIVLVASKIRYFILHDMRINQFLAHFAGLSRRKADQAISTGRIKVNNLPAVIGQNVSEDDIITIDDTPIKSIAYTYVMFHKPTGYVTSRQKQGKDPIIYDLLPEKYKSLKPIGRLDKDTSGLLLLTNDGVFAETLAHPRSEKTKVYHAQLDSILDESTLAQIQKQGIKLDDGISRMSLHLLSKPDNLYEVRITEGRNRQIRRTFGKAGYTVKALHRTQFGPYNLDNLSKAKYRELDSPQVIQ